MREHEADDSESKRLDSDFMRQKVAELDATFNTILTGLEPKKMNLIGT